MEEKKEKLPEKEILQKLQKQMEYYFSDSNLLHDKFMQKYLAQNSKGTLIKKILNLFQGFMSLGIFLNFNKVKNSLEAINTNKQKHLDLLRKAVSTSQTLIKRIVKFIPNETLEKEHDQKMIYIENIPKSMTHEQLKPIFEKAGEIVHISIPKSSEKKLNKGFAFVEYKELSSVQKAIQQFNNTNIIEHSSEFSSSSEDQIENLRIYEKEQWLKLKLEFQVIKKDLQKKIDEFKKQTPQENIEKPDYDLHKKKILKE